MDHCAVNNKSPVLLLPDLDLDPALLDGRDYAVIEYTIKTAIIHVPRDVQLDQLLHLASRFEQRLGIRFRSLVALV